MVIHYLRLLEALAMAHGACLDYCVHQARRAYLVSVRHGADRLHELIALFLGPISSLGRWLRDRVFHAPQGSHVSAYTQLRTGFAMGVSPMLLQAPWLRVIALGEIQQAPWPSF